MPFVKTRDSHFLLALIRWKGSNFFDCHERWTDGLHVHNLYSRLIWLISSYFHAQNVSIFCQQSVWIGLVVCAPITAIVLNAGNVFRLLGQTEEVIKLAERWETTVSQGRWLRRINLMFGSSAQNWFQVISIEDAPINSKKIQWFTEEHRYFLTDLVSWTSKNDFEPG